MDQTILEEEKKLENHYSNKLISIVIPAYNEAKIISATVNHLVFGLEQKKLNYELLIIENGSSDNTLTLAQSLSDGNIHIRVFSNKIGNYGLALRRGMEEAKGEILVNFDADYYDLNFLALALEKIQQGYDLVIASKHLKESKDKRSFFRKAISKCFNLILRSIYGLKVSDTHGIKAWKNTLLLKETIKETKGAGNIFDTELIIRIQKKQIKVLEIPIKVKEIREARSGILRRAFKTLFELMALFRNLYLRK